VKAYFSYFLTILLGCTLGGLIRISPNETEASVAKQALMQISNTKVLSESAFRGAERIEPGHHEFEQTLKVPIKSLRDIKSPFLIWNSGWEINPVWAGIFTDAPAKLNELRAIFHRSYAELRRLEKSLCKVSSSEAVMKIEIPEFTTQGGLIRLGLLSDLNSALPSAKAHFVYRLLIAQSFDNGFDFGVRPKTISVSASEQGISLISLDVGYKSENYKLEEGSALRPHIQEIVHFATGHESKDP
jgi:hypothetical protein